MRSILSVFVWIIGSVLLAPVAVAQEGFTRLGQGFTAAGAAHRGVVAVQQGARWGLMNVAGQWVVSPSLDAVGAAGDGLFAVKQGDKWGMVDLTGRLILNYEFDGIGTPSALTPVQWQGAWWVLQAYGQWQDQPLAMDRLVGNDGDCFTGTAEGAPVIETRGPQAKVLRPNGVTEVRAPAEGYVVATLNGAKVHLGCAFGQPGGMEPSWDEARAMSEGLAAVRTGDLWSFQAAASMSSELPPLYRAARDFTEGLAPVQMDNGLWGYINRRGVMVIAPQFEAAFGFSDGLAGVVVGGKRGFITYDGRFAIEPQFDDFWRHDGGVVAVREGEGWSVIAPKATDPATRFDLPLERLGADLAARGGGFEIIASSPHSYSAQDTVSLHSISLTPDQSVMVTVLSGYEKRELALWDFRSKKLIRKMGLEGVTQAVVLPGVEIVAAGTDRGEIALLDAVTGQVMHRFLAHDRAVLSMVLSPDGTKLASVAETGLRVWDLVTGKMLFSHARLGHVARFATDSGSLWLGNQRGGLVHLGMDGGILGDVPDGPGDLLAEEGRGWTNDKSRPDIALSATGVMANLRTESKQLADETYVFLAYVELTDLGGLRRVNLPESLRDVLTMDINEDGTRIAYAGSQRDEWTTELAVMDLATQRNVMSRQLSIEDLSPEGVETGLLWVDRLAFVPGGPDLIVVGGEGGDILQLDTQSNRVRAVIGKPLAQARTVVLPDGKRLFSSDGDGHLLIWDMDQGRLEARIDSPVAGGVEEFIGTDGQSIIIADGFDDSVFAQWDARTLAPVPIAPGATITGFDGMLIDSGGTAPKPSPEVEALLIRLGQPPYMPMLVFDQGRLAGLGDSAGTTRIYDLRSGALLVTSLADRNGEWVVLTPEGFFAASAKGAQLVSVSNGLRSFAVDQVFQALFRPDLVAAKLAGDPEGKVAAAAAQLDLSVILGSGPAPRTRFSFPPEGSLAADEVIEVGVEVADEGGGVGRIEWRVNGLTVEVQDAGARGLAALEEQVADVAKARVALEPGDNLIEVIAYNAAGLLASAPRSLTLRWDGVASRVPPALHVLSVGVNDYADGRLALKYAAADARAFAAAIGKAGAGVFTDVNVVTLLDGEVTKTGLDAAFAQMAGQVKSQDVFIFFLAGHGKTVEGEYHFIPADFTFAGDDPIREKGVRQDQWQAWMAAIKARKSIMIYDTCESGSLTGTRSVDSALAQSAAVSRLTRAMGRTILSASTDDAPALEGYRGHGVMTYALLQALGEGDANGNATIEVTELAGFLDRMVPEISQAAFNFRQVPQMSIRGSDFALGAQVTVLGDAPERFPATLTHVVAGGTSVLDGPGGAELQRIEGGVFFGVFLIEQRDGFARVAKEGTALGWVPVSSLGRLQ